MRYYSALISRHLSWNVKRRSKSLSKIHNDFCCGHSYRLVWFFKIEFLLLNWPRQSLNEISVNGRSMDVYDRNSSLWLRIELAIIRIKRKHWRWQSFSDIRSFLSTRTQPKPLTCRYISNTDRTKCLFHVPYSFGCLIHILHQRKAMYLHLKTPPASTCTRHFHPVIRREIALWSLSAFNIIP